MHAQVVRLKFQPGKEDEALGLFRDSILPAARQQKGFKGGYMCLDRVNNRGIGFTLWETAEDVEALATSGFFQQQVAKGASVFAAPPEREVYEIAVEA